MSVAENYTRKPDADEATIIVDGAGHSLPIHKATLGPDVVDITSLYQETGHFTYDPGFTSTASCESKITYIDGDKGLLLYRGYPIDQLAERGNFIETCYLLLYGELPSADQFATFQRRITRVDFSNKLKRPRQSRQHKRHGHPASLSVPVLREESSHPSRLPLGLQLSGSSRAARVLLPPTSKLPPRWRPA